MEEKQLRDICICKGCPSYKDCSKEGDKGELAFCLESVGKSKCIIKSRGCICGGCLVKKQMGFKHIYFCIDGSEKKQAK